MKRALRWIAAAAVLAALALAFDFYRTIYVAAVTGEPFHFEFVQGRTFDELSLELARAGLMPNADHRRRYWRFYARLRGADRRVRAGMYRIEANTTLHKLLDDLVSGNTLRYRFTIYEGWNLREIIAAMREHPQIKLEITDPDVIRERLGIAEASPEGWIYPETYVFEKNENNLRLLMQAHELMKEKLDSAWRERTTGLPIKSPYEALILASIIEKETAIEDERERIAGVFISRLRRGIALQADPTVIYGLGEAFDGDLRKRDLLNDTPYNSYTRKGLPPTPIAMPSEESIAAVLDPDVTGDLYFVAKGDGSHHFSKTYAEHHAAVRRYQLGK